MRVIPPIAITPSSGFARSTTASYVDSAGVLQTAAINAPRWHYNPITLAAEGLMLELAATNYVLQSGDFANAAWLTSGTISKTTGLAAPNGSTLGCTLDDTDAVVYAQAYQNFTVANDSALRYPSVWLRQGTSAVSTLRFVYLGGTTKYGDCVVNWATRTISAGGDITAADISKEEFPGGWMRIAMAVSNNSSGNTSAQLSVFPAGFGTTGSCGAWGAQLENDRLSSYIPTAGAPVTRGADLFTGTFLTNVPEPTTGLVDPDNDDPAAWTAASHAYVVGDMVYLASTHRKYQARTNHTSSALNTPANATVDTPSTDWADAGATNAYAGLDLRSTSRTRRANSIVYALQPGARADSIGMDGLTCNTVTVKVIRNGAVIYEDSATMTFRNTLTWYEYVHGSFIFRNTFARFDLPPYSDCTIVVIVDRPGSEAELGSVGVGLSEYIGGVQFDADDDALNFSRIDRDAFGNSTLLKRRSVPRTIQNIWLDKSRVNKVRALRRDLNAEPAYWSGLDDDTEGYFEALFIRGIYRRFSINLKHQEHAIISLELEEV